MSDAEYLDAVRRGDMKSAQRMVDEAAKAAGYTEKAFHGSPEEGITVFDRQVTSVGYFFSPDENTADYYTAGAGKVYAVWLKMGKTLDLTEEFNLYDAAKEVFGGAEERDEENVREFAERLYNEGYGKNKQVTEFFNKIDGIEDVKSGEYSVAQLLSDDRIGQSEVDDLVAKIGIKRVSEAYESAAPSKDPNVQSVVEAYGSQDFYMEYQNDLLEWARANYDSVILDDPSSTGESISYVVFNSNQIKSADPVTYDDAGNVIPLSKRFDPSTDDIRNPLVKYTLNYTDPTMRERLKRKIMAGSKGGNPGQWSARKAQLLAAEYEKAGGGYTGGRSKSQQSLSRWTKQDWRTKSGKPSLETGERYLPAAAIRALSSAEYAASTQAKRSASGQFSKQPKRIAMKTKRYRNPATSEDMPGPFLRQGSSRDPIPPQRSSPQIDTPAFRKWFDGSVVTTRDGKPRMMYHGTGWTNLREFKSHRARGQIAGFFAFDPGFAQDFAMTFDSSDEYGLDDEDELGVKKAATIYPVYLSLKKVFDVRKKEDRDEIEFDGFAKINGWQQPIEGWTWNNLENHLLVRRMKEAGFDGYIDFEKGSKNTPTGIAVFDSRNVKSTYGNRGTFDPMDPDITNPMDPRSSKTQIATTVDTYRKAAKMLGGKVIDYGAGLGLGTDALREEGLLADSFEPYPERWKGKRPPTYTDSAEIPSASYDSLVSFSVINVVEPDVRKFLFQEVARILQPDGIALITGRTRQDVSSAKIKKPHLEDGGYLVGEDQRYQKGFTQAELERYAKEVLGPGFTVETNRALNGASIKITKGKVNPAKRDTVRSKLSRIIEPGDRMLCYDTASGEDFYRLWDIIHTAMPMTKEALVEVEGMLDDDGVLVIESGESPAGLQDHFRKATRYNGLLLVQGPKNPEQARIETEKLRRDLE